MNYINKILIMSLAILGLVSCQDLDVEPKNFYSGDNFFESLEEANAGLLYAYDALTYTEYSRGVFYIGELPSDNTGVKDDEGNGAQELNRWTYTGNEVILLDYYRYCYIAINRANAVIECLLNNNFSGAENDRILGEAYFLRAWSHFNLVRTYGLTPYQRILVDELSETTAEMPADLNEYYTYLIDDAKEASMFLKVNQMAGQSDKVAAQALLAKVYLYAASAKESGVPSYNHITEEVDVLYASAKNYADSVINFQSTYTFDDDLLSIYNIDNSNTISNEHIFVSSMDVSGTEEGDYSKIGMLFIPNVDASEFYIMDPDSVYTRSGKGFGVFETNESLVAKFNTTDLRRQNLIVDEIYDFDTKESLGTYEDGTVRYRFTRKYVDPFFEGDKSSAKPLLLRYSDILLVYAEALGEGAEALEAYNKIRRRANAEELESLAGLTKDDFRTLIIEERQREMAFEGDRLHDLRRKKIVQTEVAEAAGLTDLEASFYPIPQREIDLNPNID